MSKILTIHTLKPDEVVGYDDKKMRLGVLALNQSILVTVEKPFIPNKEAPDKIGGGVPFKSAVPLGEYILVKRDSPEKGLAWHFHNPELGVFLTKDQMEHEWQRYSTMFHVANMASEVVGCIGTGLRLHDFGPTTNSQSRYKGLGVASSMLGNQMIKDFLKKETTATLRII